MLAMWMMALQVELNVEKPFTDCHMIGYEIREYGDWDLDGRADFLISAVSENRGGKPTIALVSGRDGKGLLVLRGSGGPLDNFGGILFTCPDLDGDALPEIVAHDDGACWVYAGRDGKRLHKFEDVPKCLIGDVNKDGHPDWLAVTPWSEGKLQSFVLDSGKTGARLRTLAESHGLVEDAVLLKRAESDNVVALLEVGKTSATVSLRQASDGAVANSLQFEIKDRAAARLCAAGDLNGDGCEDLIVSLFCESRRSDLGESGWDPGRVLALSGRDLSVIREYKVDGQLARFGFSICADADIDGDGVRDLLATEYGDLFVAATRHAAFLISGATGKTLRSHIDDADFGCLARFVGDVDGDGVADYAVSNRYYFDHTTTEPGSVQIFSGKSGALLRTWDYKGTR
jgi:hypothetical protein